MLETTLLLHESVEELDLPEIASYIAEDNPEAAVALVREIRSKFLQLAQHPGLGVRYRTDNRALAGVRMIPVPRYSSHLIFYVPMPANEGVRILYVLHGARDLKALFKDDMRH